MTVEEVPRYIVQMDFPGNTFIVGRVIEKRKYMSGKWYIPGVLYNPDDYPHIFKKITQQEYDSYINKQQP